MTYSIAVPILRKPMIVWPRERYRVIDVVADSPWEALEYAEKSEGVKCCRILTVDVLLGRV